MLADRRLVLLLPLLELLKSDIGDMQELRPDREEMPLSEWEWLCRGDAFGPCGARALVRFVAFAPGVLGCPPPRCSWPGRHVPSARGIRFVSTFSNLGFCVGIPMYAWDSCSLCPWAQFRLL